MFPDRIIEEHREIKPTKTKPKIESRKLKPKYWKLRWHVYFGGEIYKLTRTCCKMFHEYPPRVIESRNFSFK